MIRTKEEILERIKAVTGDDTGDETLGLIEDVTDTLTDFEHRTQDSTNWEQKYKDNDAEWRKKYHDRFFNSNGDSEDDSGETDDTTPMTFDDLFKEG